MLNGDGEMLRELERFATSNATEEVVLKLGSLRRCQSSGEVSAGRRLRIGGTTIGIHGAFSQLLRESCQSRRPSSRSPHPRSFVAPSGFGDLSALILHTGLPFSETDNGRYSVQGLLKPLRTVCPSTVVLSVQKCARMFPIRVSFGAGDAQQLRFGSASRHQTWGESRRCLGKCRNRLTC
jgi:hypothetical protein